MTALLHAEPLVRFHAVLGEGPRWDHRIGQLMWVDILSGLVHVTDVSTGVTSTTPVHRHVGAIALLGSDSYLLATGGGFARLDGSEVGPFSAVVDDPSLRMNDGVVDQAGRFLAGTMAYDSTPGAGKLYSRDPSGQVVTLLDSVTISNGIDWSSDGGTMYYVDSPTRRVDVFDYDLAGGRITNRRPFVSIPEGEGHPDGICRDTDGGLWVALWDGSCIRRFDQNGDLTHQVRLPVPQVTACAFGGSSLDQLYITTASVGRASDQLSPCLDGALFVCEPGFTGVASNVIPD